MYSEEELMLLKVAEMKEMYGMLINATQCKILEISSNESYLLDISRQELRQVKYLSSTMT